MTRRNDRQNVTEINAVVAADQDLMQRLVERTVQEVLEAEMSETLGAGKGERTAGRRGYRSGHYGRNLVTRVGPLELRVPQDREGQFSTELFERYQLERKGVGGRFSREVRPRGQHPQGQGGDSRSCVGTRSAPVRSVRWPSAWTPNSKR